MPSDYEVRGAEELVSLAKAFKSASNGKELRKDLLRNLRAAGKPVADNIKSNLRDKLPQRGGLAADMGRSRIGVRNRLSGKKAGIRLDVKHSKHDIAAIDRGIVRHPVFGHDRWVTQEVPARLVTDPVEEGKPTMQRAVIRAMTETASKIERSV